MTRAVALSEHARVLERSLDRWWDAKREIWGVPTGLRSYDLLTGGLQPTELTVLAGRPSMGKSTFAGQVSFNIAEGFARAKEAGEAPRLQHVGFFSLEMSGPSILLREVSRRTGISPRRIHQGDLDPEEKRIVLSTLHFLRTLPIVIFDGGGITVDAVKEDVAFMAGASMLAPGLLVFDYLQRAGGRQTEGYARVTATVRGLGDLARQYEIPVLALSMISREVERRDDPTPRLSDLKEAGTIEDDADVVTFLHRPDYFKKVSERTQMGAERVQVIVAKARNGEIGALELGFSPQFLEFTDEANTSGSPF